MSGIQVLRGAAVSVAVLMLSGAHALVSAQSLAEVAKKEEERRKSIPKPAKVYTNKDLSALPAGSPPPATAAGDAKDAKAAPDAKDATGSKDAAADATRGEKKDQAYWSGKLKALRDQLDRDQTFLDAIQNKINSLTTDFVNRDDPAQRSVIERDRQKALAELARLQKAIIDDKKAIADFEEEARRAGVSPGWLR